MYIMVNDIIGEKTIDLSYPIYPEKEIAVVSMFSNNSQILFQKSMEVLLYTGKKIVLNKGVYTNRELDSLIGTELKSQMLDSHDDVLRTNKLKEIMKVAISLNELYNSDNLEDGRPHNTLFTYYAFRTLQPSIYETQIWRDCFLNTENNGPNNNIMNNGPGITAVIHIQ